MNKFISYLFLFRSFESGLLSGSFMVFAILSGVIELTSLFLIAVAVLALNFGIVSWNDSLDVAEDSVSHPERPIPSGNISITEARIIGSFFILLSIVFVGLIDIRGILIFVAGFIIALGYSIFSKKQFLAKNLTVTVMIMLALLLVPWIFDKPLTPMLWIFALSVAIMLSGYEILKDLRDVKGDASAGIDTIPLRFNTSFAAQLATSFFLISCLLMVAGFAYFSLFIEALVALVATIAIMFPLYWLMQNPTPERTDYARYTVIILLSGAITIIGALVYLGNTNVI